MCKLSLNIVQNVYISLQSSFLSLAWPWPGRSLPKGIQWEWWDPQQRPLPGLGEVGHSPRGTSGSAGTLDWGPMWLGSQSTCHLQCTPTPQCPLTPLFSPDATYTPLAWVPTLPANPQCTPDTPYTPDVPQSPNGPMPLQHPYTLRSPLMPHIPLLAWVPKLQSSNAPWHPYTPWWPQSPLMAPIHPWHP